MASSTSSSSSALPSPSSSYADADPANHDSTPPPPPSPSTSSVPTAAAEDSDPYPTGSGTPLVALKLPFKPVLDLSPSAIAALVADMDAADASVPPVLHTVGGSAQGYRRWSAFVARGGLDSYAKRRNDALDPAGVSRLSCYHNLGMVR